MSSDVQPVLATQVDVRREPSNGEPCFVVTAIGEIDLSTAAELRGALTDVARHRGAIVKVDLGRLDFMDSSGVHALLEGRQAIQRGGGSLTVVDTSPPVARVLALLGLTDLLAPV